MKAIIEFNLPDDQEEYDIYNNAVKLYNVLVEFKGFLRSQIKYNDNLTEQEIEVYEKVRDYLFDAIFENNIGVDL